jgi:hypothetical protein
VSKDGFDEQPMASMMAQKTVLVKALMKGPTMASRTALEKVATMAATRALEKVP